MLDLTAFVKICKIKFPYCNVYGKKKKKNQFLHVFQCKK